MNTNGRVPAGRRRASVVAVVGHPREASACRLAALDGVADAVEVRCDIDPSHVRRHFCGRLVWSAAAVAGDGRRQRLVAAADAGYDVVDLHWPDDLTADVLERVPPERRRISWHGPAAAAPSVEDLRAVPAALYVVLLEPGPGAMAAVRTLHTLAADDVSACVAGDAGRWSRVLAPWRGAPVAFGRACPGAIAGAGDGDGVAPDDGDGLVADDGLVPDPWLAGMPTVADLIADYGLPDLPPVTHLYGIVGRRPRRSLSPRLHNAAYRALGLPALYLPFLTDALGPWWVEVAEGLGLRGVTVTAPHKEEALALAHHVSVAACRAGAANLVVRRNGSWQAYTTDASAVPAVLARCGVDLTGQPAAVVGCGGAGRAAAASLVAVGARVTLVNRGPQRGRLAAELLDLPVLPLAGLDPSPYALVVHATPLVDEAPFAVDGLNDGATVLDMVYATSSTRLVDEARGRHLVTIDGWEVLMAEVADQFRLMTGHPLPAGVGDGLGPASSE